MVLMAIDHVRVYSGQPAGGPTPGIFFTRWITHFVAPAFVFLAGTSAYLYGQRVGDKKKLAQFLLTRGLWLVLLELTVLRVAWTFNFDFRALLAGGRHLDDRLVHGADVGDRVSPTCRDRGGKRRDPRRPQSRRSLPGGAWLRFGRAVGRRSGRFSTSVAA